MCIQIIETCSSQIIVFLTNDCHSHGFSCSSWLLARNHLLVVLSDRARWPIYQSLSWSIVRNGIQVRTLYEYMIYLLVDGIPTPLKNMKVNGKDDIPYTVENKTSLKPPSSLNLYIPVFLQFWWVNWWSRARIFSGTVHPVRWLCHGRSQLCFRMSK